MKNPKANTRRLLLSTLIALSSEGVLAGDIQQEGPTITPMIGYITHDEDKQSVKDAASLSLAAGYQFNSPWAVELAYQLSQPDRVPNSDADSEQMRIDSLYHFGRDDKTQPFALFGFGASDIEGGALDIDDTMLNAGLGVKYHFTDMVSFRTDFRAIRQLDTEATQIAVNLGLQIFFGSKQSSSAAIATASKKEIDTDGDGVIDRLDSCPNTPENSQVDATGCALNTDIDGDGVANNLDKCPDTKPGAKVTAEGCYEVLKEDVTVELNIKFANNSDQISQDSLEEIKPLAEFLKQFPQTKVVIEGHTDDRGAASYNKSLSQKRADSVANVLVTKFNIQTNRLQAIGYGEEKPIASNDTAEGRAENRRVQAVVKATIEKTAE